MAAGARPRGTPPTPSVAVRLPPTTQTSSPAPSPPAAGERAAVGGGPALSSHFEVARQVIKLPSPPWPLHSELSTQVSWVGPIEAELHLAPVSQRSAQPAILQVVLQSLPAEQAQLLS